ncbi:MAG: bifunctional 3-(3-hydroxy-phenyl)propionate/3-hydroxycinnamic acid hydroxylase [Burkholderiaceae bacterium]|nr:bifunctional 3-(3-hydroxy-phenyl)propionate/3-hydroxycinnamic acid hydroxylase [Burkholderiaceae bacterium]
MTQTLPTSVDVLLVGMGPVGATAANLLGRYGVRALVIDKSQEIFMAPRAIALDNEALRILQMAGLEDGAFATCAIPEVQMHSPMFGYYARAKTGRHIDEHPSLVTFYQPELEKVLRERVANYPCVQTALGMEIVGFSQDEYGVVAILSQGGKEFTVHARYLVGVDGANSFVRRHAGMTFEGKTFTQDWLVVDVLNAPTPINHVEFHCDPRRPTPHMPAPGNRQRWEFMLHPNETREQMEHPDTIKKLLKPWCDASKCNIERTAVYRFHARIVDRFSKGRVFLAGDAAHITPPFVGQGLVAGLRDVANLCWKLAWVVQDRAPQSILDSYDIERRPHARSIINLARLMGGLVMPRSYITAFFVHGFMWAMHRFPITRGLFEDLEIKPANRFMYGLFQRGRSSSKLVRGGQVPQGQVRSGHGAATIRSDDYLGNFPTLVGFGCDPTNVISLPLLAAWTSAGGTCLTLRSNGQSGLGRNSLEDATGTLVPGAAPVGWVAVIRPDRTVLHDGPLANVDTIIKESLELMGCTTPDNETPAIPVAR